MQRPGQRRCQVEPEAVDVHFGCPVAEGVHDHREDGWRAHVQGVAAAGVVGITRRITRRQPVVRGVVDSAEGQDRSVRCALGGVVVNHIENDLDPGRVEGPNHRFELPNLVAPARGICLVRSEEAQRVIAPVVGQAPALDGRLGDEVLDGKQLDRGHSE